MHEVVCWSSSLILDREFTDLTHARRVLHSTKRSCNLTDSETFLDCVAMSPVFAGGLSYGGTSRSIHPGQGCRSGRWRGRDACRGRAVERNEMAPER